MTSDDPNALAGTSPLRSSLYVRLLGTEWTQLDQRVRQAHLVGERLSRVGTFGIRRGRGWLARSLATILRLPCAGDAVPTRLIVVRTPGGEKWIRSFACSTMVTTQTADSAGVLRERLGMIEIVFRLEVTMGALVYRQVGAALRLGLLRVPLPRWLWPDVEALEEASGPSGTHVSVRVTLPLAGPLISYDGRLSKQEAA